ncbi:MAG: hypothetical protein B6I28_04485 [Fusobacteriia bacterium 4572_132]|nr:MAG: hypothetical protein B6I28_04485 [Fusobacteriia bacterium 4572_132]
MSKIDKLLNTMELVHYMEKFKNKVFIFVVTEKNYIRDIIPDIIILQSFNIKVVLILGYKEDEELEKLMQENNKMILKISSVLKKNHLNPLPFLGSEIYTKKIDGKVEITGFDTEILKFALNKNKIPIIMPTGMDKRGNYNKLDGKEIALELAKTIKSDMVYLISELDGIEVNGEKRQFLNYSEVIKILKRTDKLDNKTKEILEYSLRLMDFGVDCGILKGETGNIYGEVFSYDTYGTLIKKVDDERIRNAYIEDVQSIYLLIKNEVNSNNILPIKEDDIEEEISDYIVYDVDNSIVALGKLNDYNEAAEIAKIATFPRYQGGKKAKKLCEKLIKKAAKKGKKYVFGLSVNDKMIRLFEGLNFYEVDRENLPMKWKENYDFTRPSRAFRLDLENEK